jgi:hypothetical protein
MLAFLELVGDSNPRPNELGYVWDDIKKLDNRLSA